VYKITLTNIFSYGIMEAENGGLGMEGVETRRSLYGFEMREPDLRRKDSTRKTHNIKQLWQWSHEILNLAVRGMKPVEIAEILNITSQTVSNTLNSDLGMQKLSEMRKKRDEDTYDTVKEIDDLTKKALEVYHEIFDDKTETHLMKKKVADTVTLELSGLKVPTRIQSHNIHQVATKEEIEEWKKRGIDAGRESGMIIDLPVEEPADDSLD